MNRLTDEELKLLKFVSRPDCWYVEGSVAICDGGWFNSDNEKYIEQMCGSFGGWTNETYHGYNGELPRYDGEICPFDEFDIYFNDTMVNELTTEEVRRLIKLDKL